MTMLLLMVDELVKIPVRILSDVLVRVDKFIFPADFVILECQVDFEVPIILRRPFLSTGRALVNVEHRELTFLLNAKEVKFNMCASMKRPKEVLVMSIVDVEDAYLSEVPIKERWA